jgi:tetratricopeptide (TPR) repeat protein
MNRYEVPAWMKLDILTLYDHTCAGCGTNSKLSVDVAHLYEDATIRAPRLDGLLVLCSSCNQAEARARFKAKPALSERLDAHDVFLAARRLYRDGMFMLAYASYRLSAYLFENYCGRYSKAVTSLVEALTSLRPVRKGDFLAATIREIARLCKKYTVGVIPRWQSIERIALALFTYRRWDEAIAVQDAAAQLQNTIRGDELDPQELWLDQINSARRGALITSLAGNIGNVRKTISRLIEDADDFLGVKEYNAFATNLDVASKIECELSGSLARAYNYSEQAIEMASKVDMTWVKQEHYWRGASYFHSKQDSKKTLGMVVSAFREFNAHPVALEPRHSSAGPVLHNPITELARYGISVDQLREHGVAPSCNPPAEDTLPLSRAEVKRIVDRLMK